jgi:hypothetical protein
MLNEHHAPRKRNGGAQTTHTVGGADTRGCGGFPRCEREDVSGK